jgi:hypothetical protein
MDTNTTLLSTTTGTTIIGLILIIYRAINHRRIRSNCCGRDIQMSVDVENTTPPAERFIVQNPQRKISVEVK